MPNRSRKETKRYKKHKKTESPKTDCEFCDITKGYEQFISETKSFKIIHNIFGYSYWDTQSVTDHLLLVPKKHTDKLGDLTRSEMVEFMDIITSYESRGYNVYIRAPSDKLKTIVHQHTHLIQPSGKMHRIVFYIRRPYFRIIK